MNKLEKLIQIKIEEIPWSEFVPIGNIKTLVVKHPRLEISKEIEKMQENKSSFIPKFARYYVASKFNADTQHIKKSNDEKSENFYSVYAVQFYF
ncbi:hypothetical protein J4411_02860 [Candidatus Pacearchaeota archaeon]|nr:hypothetical protein [Candidatus Pacearchaeota archaeon]